MKVAHLTTVDLSLRYLVYPQLLSVRSLGGEALGISAPGPWVEELREAGIRHLALPSSTRGVAPVADLRAAWELWRILRTEQPDVLHTHNPKPGLYGRILGRWAGVPIVVNTVHGLYAAPDDPLTKRIVVYLLEALAARFSDLELVQSSEDLALMIRMHIARRGRAVLLGNGVDLARFNPDRPDLADRNDLRRALDLPPDQIVVGMVGRLVAEKGYPELFEAARALGRRYTVLVIGPEDPEKPDALPPDMVQRAREAGVRFLGMRTDVDELYRAMDLFVLPSHREGFPRAAMEAAAMGLPLVATDIRGCREVVSDRENGILVPVGDPERLAAAIRTLGDDTDLRHRYSLASRAKAAVSFDETQVVQRVLDAYRRAADERGLVDYREALAPSEGELVIRPALPGEAPAIARLHIDGISEGFLSTLGAGFMRRLYTAMIDWDEAVVLVADRGMGPIGFVAGVADTAGFYRHFARRGAARALLAALPTLVRPSTIRRAWETARYGGEEDDWPDAELLSMAVSPRHRGAGVGLQLGLALLDRLAQGAVDRVKVVVGSSNQAAIRAYESMGFLDAGTTEVHPGETSRVMVWSA